MENAGKTQLTIDDLAAIVKIGFDDIGERMATKDDLKAFATKDDLKAFATKEDLTSEIGKLRSDMIDYIAKENMLLKGDLVVLLRGEDKKLFALIELLVKKSLLSRDEAQQVAKLEPFPQAM